MVKSDKRKQDEEVSYWLSYSDMMSGMLLTFVLIIAVMMFRSQSAIATRQSEMDTKELELQQLEEELMRQRDTIAEQSEAMYNQQIQIGEKDNIISDKEAEIVNKDRLLGELEKLLSSQEGVLEDLVGVKTEIIKALNDEFKNSNLSITVDKKTGAITMNSDILFDSGKYTLKDNGKTSIQDFMSRYINILLSDKYKSYVSEIVIEGHTDTVGDYLYNLDLSQKRAYSVAEYVLNPSNNVLDSNQAANLEKVLTAIGKSYSSLVVDSSGHENLDASRRVEIKFRLRDEDMIQEMLDILNERNSKIDSEETE